MSNFKAFKGLAKKHLEKFGEPDEKDYALIKEFLNVEIKKSDIFVYCIKLCDNYVDREGEFFSSEALSVLTEKFVGISGIHNHEWNSGNQHSRIYKTELITRDDEKTDTLEPYQYIVGYAYTVTSEKSKPLIGDIGSGILKEVSIGFEHVNPASITLEDGREVTRIDNVTDVYEWSFVAVPAQRMAGVVKSFKNGQEDVVMDFKNALVQLKSLKGVDAQVVTAIESGITDLEAGATSLKSLKATIKSLETEVEEKGLRVKELEESLTSTNLAHALASVFTDLNPVSDSAKDLATSIVEKGLAVGEDGTVTGVEEAKAKLKSDYPFLFNEAKSETDEVVAEKGVDEEEVEEKEVDIDNVVTAKSLDFTKSAQKAFDKPARSKKFGMHF